MTVSASGDWTQSRAREVLGEAHRYVEAGTVDLSTIGRVDSAAVALLLELKRRAALKNRPLRFTGAPSTLVALTAFFGVEAFLLG